MNGFATEWRRHVMRVVSRHTKMPAYFYCRKWFTPKRMMTEPFDEATARSRHSAKETYGVVVDSKSRPNAVLLVGADFVAVDFLDEHSRVKLSYHFQEKSPGNLFLTMAVHRQFVGETDQVMLGTRYSFDLDGKVEIRREQFVPKRELEVASSTADTARNWESFPAFGAYEHLLKVERQSVC